MKIHYRLVYLTVVLFCSFAHGANKKMRIVFLGDSLTAGYGVDVDKAYPSVLARKWKNTKPHVEVVNASISGSTTAGAAGRLQWQLKNKPDLVVLALGSNDGLRGFDLATSRKNLEDVIILAKKNRVKVVLVGMQLPTNYGPEYREKFKQMYVELKTKHELSFVPFLLEGVGGEVSMNISDGIHPNEKGHERMASNIAKVLETLI